MIIPIFVVGFTIIHKLVPRFSLLEKIFLGLAIGFGIFVFLVSLILINYSLDTNLLRVVLWIITIPLLYFLKDFFVEQIKNLLEIDFRLKPDNKNLDLFEVALICGLMFISITIVVSLLVWPVNAWDSVALYDFRGRYFLLGNSLGDMTSLLSPNQILSGKLYYFSYPLFTSLSHLVSYLSGVSNPKWIYIIYSVGLYLLIYRFLVRNKVKVKFVLLITFILSLLTFNLSIIAYTNMPYTFFISLSVLYLYEWTKTKEIRLLVLATLLIVISTTVRNTERLYLIFFLITSLLFVLNKGHRFLLGLCAIITSLSGMIWGNIVKYVILHSGISAKIHYVGNTVGKALTDFSVERLYKVIIYYNSSISSYYPFLLLFIFFVIIDIRNGYYKIKEVQTWFFPLTIIVFFLFMLAGTYFLSFQDTVWDEIGGSLTRAMLPILPLILSYVGLRMFSE